MSGMLDDDHDQPSLNLWRRWAIMGRRATRFFLSLSWVRELFLAVALALVIIIFLYQPVKVEGTSMAPELNDQERIFINKFVYHFEPVERGDIIVFRYPRDPRKSFVKRVIGMPGERVEIRAGRVYVNGVELVEAYLDGSGRDTLSASALLVPPDHYYVLGDHRTTSNDSRTWGCVHRRFIYGKAVFIYWPPERFGSILQSYRADTR